MGRITEKANLKKLEREIEEKRKILEFNRRKHEVELEAGLRKGTPLTGGDAPWDAKELDKILELSCNSEHEQKVLRDTLHQITISAAQNSFYAFVQLIGPYLVPGFIDSPHIKLVCDAMQRAYEVPDSRIMIFLPPGASKSVLGSTLFPAWWVGKDPTKHILHVTYSADFTQKFGGEIRDLIMSPAYQEIFPDTKINPNIAGKATWETTAKGRYWSAGATGSIAGKRGHINIVDDVVTEQNYQSKAYLESLYNWWPGGFESRLLKGSSIIVIGTRWCVNDLSGWLLERSEKNPELDQWELVKIPAIVNNETLASLLGVKVGDSFDPIRWPKKRLDILRMGMPQSQWLALYMQEPIALDGNIIKTENFVEFMPHEKLKAGYLIVTADTAYSTKNTADYSVLQAWAVVEREMTDSQEVTTRVPCIALIDMIRGRFEYPDLVRMCHEFNDKHRPDVWVVEKKASGQSLVVDLKRRGLFIHEYIPDKDKVTRVVACTPFIDDHRVMVPDTIWAKDFVSECKSFPKGAHDDTVDCLSSAILYLRDNFQLTYRKDWEDDEEEEARREELRNRKLYW